MKITVPDVCLVVLVGASSAGKTTLAQEHFRPSEVVSSDQCRLLVADDENDQGATEPAFELLHYIVSKRLEGARLTVVDATSLLPEDRRPLLSLARAYHVPAVAVILDVAYEVAAERNAQRPDRNLPAPALRAQVDRASRCDTEMLAGEGFSPVFTLAAEEASELTLDRVRPPTDHTADHGPFDIVGDVHGCVDELVDLLAKLGYEVGPERVSARHPEGRRAIFVGDLVDRGPDTPGVLRLVMGMVREGSALCAPGNHEARLVRALQGGEVTTGHGLSESLEQLAAASPELREEVIGFLEALPSHLVLDRGQLVVAHAGLPAHMHNRDSNAVRWFSLYGDTTGETDELGHQFRYPWARDYRSDATVVYGHTPVKVPEWVNNTICVDTACVFGGSLTALRHPEREIVSIPAAKVYYQPVSGGEPDAAQTTVLSTRLAGEIPVRSDLLGAAEEAARQGGLDRRWMVHVPSVVPPGPVTTRADLLEHPEDTFVAYAEAGVAEVICEYDHGGTQAVAVLCRDTDAAEQRFGRAETGPAGSAAEEADPERSELPVGALYTREGLPVEEIIGADPAELVDELRTAVETAGLWDELATGWLALEVELLGEERFAPVTVLAAESGVWVCEDRLWHLGIGERLHDAAPGRLVATRHTRVAVADVRSRARGIAWWQDVITSGGAGMVVRPLSACHRSETGGTEPEGRGFTQPGLKCRGQSHLQALYGEDYAAPENLLRLRDRDVAVELANARAAFALGVEAVERFVKHESLERVHECCLGAMAFDQVGGPA